MSRRGAIAGGLVLVLLLSSCGRGVGNGAAGTFSPGTPGVLTVATSQIPNPGLWTGTPEHLMGGFEYGLAHALARELGLRSVRVMVVPFSDILSGHIDGADLALSDVTITEERAERVQFSWPYLSTAPAIVVSDGRRVPDVRAARQLRYVVVRHTTLQAALEESIRPQFPPTLVNNQEQLLGVLRAGGADAAMLDLPVALALAHEDPQAYSVAAQLPSEAGLGAVLPLDSPNVEAVDSALRALQAEGEIERLGWRWLGAALQEGAAENVTLLRTE